MIKRLIEKYKNNREKKKEEEKQLQEHIKSETIKMNKESNEAMANKYCPLVKSNCLTVNCVHFRKANIFYLDNGMYFAGWYGKGAGCNLTKPD